MRRRILKSEKHSGGIFRRFLLRRLFEKLFGEEFYPGKKKQNPYGHGGLAVEWILFFSEEQERKFRRDGTAQNLPGEDSQADSVLYKKYNAPQNVVQGSHILLI